MLLSAQAFGLQEFTLSFREEARRRGIAAALNEREIASARGGIWHPMAVKRILESAS